ncbi:hypothetical protein [Aureitalea marina]|nr:hypothetical protein [Aureitalea marina]
MKISKILSPWFFNYSSSWKAIQVVILLPLITLCCTITDSLQAQNVEHETELNLERNEWISQTVSKLEAIDPELITSSVNLLTRPDDGEFYNTIDLTKDSLIKLPSGDWIYVIIHSGHDNKLIGDLSIARDQSGQVYFNQGHVCGEIRYKAHTQSPITSSEEFFLHLKDSSDKLSWKKLDHDELISAGHTHD